MRAAAVLILSIALGATVAGAERAIEFNRDVRPILSDKCFHCHGTDAAAKKIPLRLDSEAAAKKDLGGRWAVRPGDAAQSELIKRITHEKKSLRMPPLASGLQLTETEIDTLRRWIEQGAGWEQHWAFIPPKRATAPVIQNAGWVRNPIDAFVGQRLDREGLAPSPEAGRETLLRRVSLDLTGLPPTPVELDAFLRDRAANAYEKAVDRLLASSRYGERMAARWLDAARYADSNGYQYDGERVMWRWRDWVIDSFNRNQRFNQFTLEQIAGDLLPNATMEQQMATGFNRNHRANTEDGIIPEEYAVEYVVDRVETTSTVFVGVTLGCARCHNHKYDPFTQKEFYQFFAYFNNVPELGRAMKYGNSPPVIPAPTREQQTALAAVNARIRAVEQELTAQERIIRTAQAAWEQGLSTGEPVYWGPPDAAMVPQMSAPGKIGRAAVFDGRTGLDLGATGAFEIDSRWTLAAWIKPDTDGGSLLSRMMDTPQGKGYGIHLREGRVHVNLTSTYADDAIRLETEQKVATGEWQHVLVTYDGSRMASGLAVYLNGKLAAVKVELDSLYRPFNNAGKAFREPFRVGAGWGPEHRFKGAIDDLRVYGRVLAKDEIAALAAGESLAEMARKPAGQRSATESQVLRWAFLESAGPEAVRAAWATLTALRTEREKLERSFPTVMVMAERPTPRDTFLLVRGAYDKPGEKVQPGVPAVLPSLPEGAPNNRLGLAKWLIDERNPLLARVTVNRFWQMYFGTGLVKTTEDFGQQGEWPSHPELLDWLATEFVRTGWDVKALQKLIVTSAAYRQSAKTSPELQQRDPENRLLARGPRFRLPAEVLRDQALFMAGLLTEKIGGPSVKPYQPAGLWKELAMQDMDYLQSQGQDLFRRSLYTYWKRTVAPPVMANFDAALRESCTVRETRTNTPLQALNLMNDVSFLEAAKFIGQRMLREGGADEAAQLRYGFRLVLARGPSAAEEQVLRDSLHYHRDYFASAADQVERFLQGGEAVVDARLDRRELAAYAAVASLLMNLDETVTKQ